MDSILILQLANILVSMISPLVSSLSYLLKHFESGTCCGGTKIKIRGETPRGAGKATIKLKTKSLAKIKSIIEKDLEEEDIKQNEVAVVMKSLSDIMAPPSKDKLPSHLVEE